MKTVFQIFELNKYQIHEKATKLVIQFFLLCCRTLFDTGDKKLTFALTAQQEKHFTFALFQDS